MDNDNSGRILVCTLLVCGIILIIIGWMRWSPDLIFFGVVLGMLDFWLAAYVKSLIGEGRVRLRKGKCRKVN